MTERPKAAKAATTAPPSGFTVRSKPVALVLLAVCELGVMAVWFSATAVVPSLVSEYDLSGLHVSLLTTAVQGGFVAGTLVSALLGLADRLDSRRFFMVCALIAAAANGSILLLEASSPTVIVMRFVTGACMAGVYPVGMKIATTWAKGDMGFLVGLLVGAITLGTATPHLMNAFGGIDWRFAIGAASVSALVAALLVNLVAIGPNTTAPHPFRMRYAAAAWTAPALRYANGGYLGHMWELFAMWAWLGVFLDASFRLAMPGTEAAFLSRLATFAAIGVGGGLGCVLGGLLADRIGRTTLTMGAMSISGACALVTGFLFGANPWLLFAVCLVWGVAVVADSAQFSAAVAELSPPPFIGTMLTVQTCVGFLLTLATIHLMPPLVEAFGWSIAFAALAIGPFLGVWSMARLRVQPEAVKLAGGRR